MGQDFEHLVPAEQSKTVKDEFKKNVTDILAPILGDDVKQNPNMSPIFHKKWLWHKSHNDHIWLEVIQLHERSDAKLFYQNFGKQKERHLFANIIIIMI